MDIRILIVEDDDTTRECLVEYFKVEQHQVFAAQSAEAAEQILSEQDIDLVLLDIRLPGKDGLTLTRELRANSELGIILVTGRQDEIERIVGLECGADDYVCKPFNPRELLARAKNLTRRVRATTPRVATTTTTNIHQFDDWRVDLDRRILLDAHNQQTPLTHGEYQLLDAFLRHSGQTLSRDQLLDQIKNREWAPNDRTIDVLVGRLRRKLQDDPANPRIILTVHGAGYVFTPRSVPCH